eukprot:232600_1
MMEKIATTVLLVVLNIVIILYYKFHTHISYGINYHASMVATNQSTESPNLTSPNLISPNLTSPNYCYTKFSKIVSYSLWGYGDCYIYGALENALIAQIFLPDWQLWFHIDENTFYLEQYANVFQLLQELNNTKIIIMKNITNSHGGLFWRFNPFFECPDIDVIISRDCDSRLNGRDQSAVEQWLSTNKQFHIIRDHTFHCTQILGGLFGARKGYLLKFKSKFMQYYNQNVQHKSGSDQIFLKKEIYFNLNLSDIFIHDYTHCYLYERVNQIPYAYSLDSTDGAFAGKIICNDFRYINEIYNKNVFNLTRNGFYS